MLSPTSTAIAIAALCYMGLLASKAATDQLAAGRHLDITVATAGIWQYAREICIVILAGALLASVARHRKQLRQKMLVAIGPFFVAVFLTGMTVATVIRPAVPVAAVLAGLRVIYITAIALAIRHYSPEERSDLLRLLAKLLLPLLLIEAVLAYQQVRYGAPTLGRTQLGARPWGTYASANNLGLAMLGILVLLVAARIRWWWMWLLPIAAVCVATGSRTAVLGFALVCGGILVARWRNRITGFPFAVLAVYSVYTWASSAAVSGRAISGEARLKTWTMAQDSLHGFSYLFGNGVGTGTNSYVTMAGTAQVGSNAAITDSAFLAAMLSLGAVGLGLYIWSYMWLWRAVAFEQRIVLLPMLGITMLTFNAPEVAPFNLLMAVAIGCSLPVCRCGSGSKHDGAVQLSPRARRHSVGASDGRPALEHSGVGADLRSRPGAAEQSGTDHRRRQSGAVPREIE